MNIAVWGALGRVGSKVVEFARKRGHNVYQIDIDYENNIIDDVDVAIDFSTADATQQVCDFCKLHRCALVTGVTGRNDEQTQLIEMLKREFSVVEKANFSVGVEFLHKICQLAAQQLVGWDCEVVEIHRKNKLDSPSGTAKSIAATVAEQNSFSKVTVHSLRAGSNFGTHAVVFASQGESLVFTHEAEGVEIFALGAIRESENLLKQTK